MFKYIYTLSVLLLFNTMALAHSGGLDSSGGHTNHKTGEYHYHSSSESSGGMRLSRNIIIMDDEEIQLVGYVDGDTIKIIRSNGKQERIRLYGVDAPEEGQAYGNAAKEALRKMLLDRNLVVEVITHDRQGRAVVVIHANGININEKLIKEGYAWCYTPYCKKEFCNQWQQHQEEARLSEKSLWKDINVQPPWEWRKKWNSMFGQVDWGGQY